MCTSLQYHLHIPNPEEMPEEEIFRKFKELEFIRLEEAKQQEN